MLEAVAATIATIEAGRAEPQAMRIFPTIPPRYGVIPVEYDSVMFKAGEVAVYDEMWSAQSKPPSESLLEDGGIYVLEYQRPDPGMSWEMWNDVGSKHGGRSRLDIRREMARIARNKRDQRLWMTHPIASRRAGVILCSDGPCEEWVLYAKIIGKVVGIYNPSAI